MCGLAVPGIRGMAIMGMGFAGTACPNPMCTGGNQAGNIALLAAFGPSILLPAAASLARWRSPAMLPPACAQ